MPGHTRYLVGYEAIGRYQEMLSSLRKFSRSEVAQGAAADYRVL